MYAHIEQCPNSLEQAHALVLVNRLSLVPRKGAVLNLRDKLNIIECLKKRSAICAIENVTDN